MIKVASLDDHQFVLEGYQAILTAAEGIHWMGGFSDGVHLQNFIRTNKCDVVLLDIHLGDGHDGIYWCKTFRQEFQTLKILGVSTFDEFGIIKTFLKNGGNGFLLKTADRFTLQNAITEVYDGKEYLQEELKQSLLDQSLKNEPSNSYFPKLSSREKRDFETDC